MELPTPFRFQDFLSPTTENIQKKHRIKVCRRFCHINLASPRLPPRWEEKHHLGGWASRWPGPPCELPNVPMNSWSPGLLKGCPTWLSNHPHQIQQSCFDFLASNRFFTRKNWIEKNPSFGGKESVLKSMCAIFLKVGPNCGILNERIQLAGERNVYICLTPQKLRHSICRCFWGWGDSHSG